MASKDKHRRNVAVIGQALTAKTRDPFLLYSLGIEYFQANEIDRGIACLTKALTLMNGGEGYFRDALITLGMGLLRAGQVDALRSHLENCLLMLPEDPDLRLLKGLLALDQGQPQEAALELHRVLACRIIPPAHLLRLLGDACRDAGRYGEAAAAYLAALSKDPRQLYPLMQILRLKQQGNHDPGWEELARFTSLTGKTALSAQLARLGETTPALVLALLAVIDASGLNEVIACCRELQRLLGLYEPALNQPKTVHDYLLVSAAEMASDGRSRIPWRIARSPASGCSATGCLDLVVSELKVTVARIPILEGVTA